MNTIGELKEIWPRLSPDEKKLFDAVARTYLAAVMPDYRYRQTTVTLDVRGFEFRASGRQPIEAGWRDAFPDWRPDDEKGEAAQALPVLRDGETARLRDPEIEDKETRPPPRYKEGTLIEAMQNAWRFVGDEALRERLKEAKGIGTPATRAEIIAGLKKQGFLAAQGKNIVPTERGLALFGVLERADPGLVDPGVTAEMECLLDDVLTGRQEMMGAIDAVCDSARRIIGRLAARGDGGEALAPVRSNARRRGPAADGGDEEICGLDREEEGHQASQGLHEVGGGLPGVPRPACARAEPGAESRVSCERAGFRRLGGREARDRRNRPVRQKGNATGEAAAAKIGTQRDRWVVRNPAAGCRVGDAASDSIRKQGTGVRPGRPIRDGRLVCAARRGSCRLSRAGMVVEACGRRRGTVRQRVY